MAEHATMQNQIKTYLEELQRAGTLGEVHLKGHPVGLFEIDYGSFPAAILYYLGFEQDAATNTENEEKSTWALIVVEKKEHAESETRMLEIMEAIKEKLNKKPSLDGKANAGFFLAQERTEVVANQGEDYVVLPFTVEGRVIKDIGLNS